MCENNVPADLSQCAALLLELAPLVTRVLRDEVRRHPLAELSMPQYRLLAFLSRVPGASLSDAAEGIGLTLSSASKQIDALLARGLVTRQEGTSDRRRVRLAATETGAAVVAAVDTATQTRLERRLRGLTPEQQEAVVAVLKLLLPRFGDGWDADETGVSTAAPEA